MKNLTFPFNLLILNILWVKLADEFFQGIPFHGKDKVVAWSSTGKVIEIVIIALSSMVYKSLSSYLFTIEILAGSERVGMREI